MSCKVSADWKLGNEILIYKTVTRGDLGNYRLFSLTSKLERASYGESCSGRYCKVFKEQHNYQV